MGKYTHILLTATPATCLDPDTIVNGEVTHFFYGPEGWVEQSGDKRCGCQGYRLISQRALDADTIMQIVEVMDDGWVPSQIYLKDIGCITPLEGGQGFKEAQVGFWNRGSMEIEMPPQAAAEAAAKPVAIPRDRQKAARPQPPEQPRSLLGPAPRQHRHHHRPNYQIRLASQKCLIAVSPLKA